MKQKIKYSNAPDEIREAFVNPIEIEDFLPPPELLILKRYLHSVDGKRLFTA